MQKSRPKPLETREACWGQKENSVISGLFWPLISLINCPKKSQPLYLTYLLQFEFK